MSDKYSNKTRQIVHAKTNGCCAYCGKVPKDTWNTCIDHMEPQIHGGVNTPDNLVIACRSCNSIKKDYFMDEFLQRILQRQTDAVHECMSNSARIELRVKRHGKDDQTSIKLREKQPLLNEKAIKYSDMVGNITRWL